MAYPAGRAGQRRRRRASLTIRALFGEDHQRRAGHHRPATCCAGPAVGICRFGNDRRLARPERPAGDDTGPGNYTYPTDAVFKPGNFDITSFQVGTDDENIVFRFTMGGPVDNPWDAPNGLSFATFDIYIDTDESRQRQRFQLQPDRGGGRPGTMQLPSRVGNRRSSRRRGRPDGDRRTGRLPEWSPTPAAEGNCWRTQSIIGDTPDSMALRGDRHQSRLPAAACCASETWLPSAEQWRISSAPAARQTIRVIDYVWPTATRGMARGLCTSTAPQGDLAQFYSSPAVEFLTPHALTTTYRRVTVDRL